MNKILLIGNIGRNGQGTDGQTVKVRLYLKKIEDEGLSYELVDLCNFLKHPFSTIRKIKSGIKKCSRIVLITAQRGSKILIPIVNFFNRKFKREFIFPLIGTSVLHYSIDKLTDGEKNDFIINHNFSYCKPKKKLVRQLKRITYILPETEQLCEVFRNFYGLSNVYCLNNFRETEIFNHHSSIQSTNIRLVFLSRVMEEKGILDLLKVVHKIHNEFSNVILDIYGKILLSESEFSIFEGLTNNSFINYCGEIDSDKVVSTLQKYDLFIFPTKFIGEGTPGVIVESLLACTPVLTSNFPQAKFLLKDGQDSIFYKMFDNDDLFTKLMDVIHNQSALIAMRHAAKESGKQYTYNHEREKFLKFVCGVKE